MKEKSGKKLRLRRKKFKNNWKLKMRSVRNYFKK
jgi:hypothetical protein